MSTVFAEPKGRRAAAPESSLVRPIKIRGWLVRLASAVPTALAFALLLGAGYVGHATGWKLPKASSLAGRAPEPADDWCAEHNVPESACVECDPALMPRRKPSGWCPVHGVGECVLHHPDSAQVAGTPAPPPYDTAGPLALLPRVENNRKCTLASRRVQFASSEAADKAGVDVDVVGARPMTESVAGHGEIGYDPTTVVRLSARTAGSVWRVLKQVGDSVEPGEVVALVDSTEVGRAKAEFATASVQVRLKGRNLDSLRRAGGAVSAQEVREAEAAAEESGLRRVMARQALATLGLAPPASLDALDAERIVAALRFLGLPKALADSLAADPAAPNTLLPVRATQAGVVVSREVVAGEPADPAKVLLTTADTRRLWLTLGVRQEDAKYVAPGRAVRFGADTGGAELTGSVAWVAPAADDKTRTVPVRADLPNPGGLLRVNTFGAGRVVLRDEPNALCVPRDAVQWEGCCNVVFVRDRNYLKDGAPKVFHARQVRVGASDDTHVELLAGVLPGEVVATKGSAVLRAELLRGGLGEGCACHKK